jgi:hypothetical protein
VCQVQLRHVLVHRLRLHLGQSVMRAGPANAAKRKQWRKWKRSPRATKSFKQKFYLKITSYQRTPN